MGRPRDGMNAQHMLQHCGFFVSGRLARNRAWRVGKFYLHYQCPYKVFVDVQHLPALRGGVVRVGRLQKLHELRSTFFWSTRPG